MPIRQTPIAPERIIHDFMCFLYTYRTSTYLQKDSWINRSGSIGGTTFSVVDDLRVVPTFQAHSPSIGSGRYGHVNNIQVSPARPSDEAHLRRAGLSWPIYLPQPVLQCLTSQGIQVSYALGSV